MIDEHFVTDGGVIYDVNIVQLPLMQQQNFLALTQLKFLYSGFFYDEYVLRDGHCSSLDGLILDGLVVNVDFFEVFGHNVLVQDDGVLAKPGEAK